MNCCETNQYIVGQEVMISGTFTDSTGALIDPTSVTIKIKQPDGTIVQDTYPDGNVERQSVGVFYYNFLTTQAGYYYVEYDAAGAAIGLGVDSFSASASPVG